MKAGILRLFFVIAILSQCISVIPQEIPGKAGSRSSVLDSLRKSGAILNEDHTKPHIVLSVSQALNFLQQRYQTPDWNSTSDPFRQALGQLIFDASNPPFDSSRAVLMKFPYDSLEIPWDKFYIWDPLRLKIPVTTSRQMPEQNLPGVKQDTVRKEGAADSLAVRAEKMQGGDSLKNVTVLKDTTVMVVIDTLHEVTSSYSRSPFRYLTYPYQADSIKVAVTALLKYLEDRDSTIINFTGVNNVVTPVWLNSKSRKMVRYWLKNEFSDSVTVWIGNPARDTIGLYLEQGVAFRRPAEQRNYSNARVDVKSLDNSKLLELQKVYIRPQYWKYRSEASFILSQSALSNWVKGGENSFSTAMDITGYADYRNKKLKISSDNFIRLKLGFLSSGGSPIRKNLDLLETNSKFNHKAFGKFDFSAIVLFKTQVAPGFNYLADTTVLVSKFMNPAVLTIGFGLDFKPNKNTSVNFSPLSYKGTFMTDTVHIDQTIYGIPHDRKSLNEPGISLMISNEFKPLKTVTIVNRLQLFTNYIHNPQNIDVDWEMIAVARLNWFTDVRFNTHLVFDDDTKTQVLDSKKEPVLNPDGTPRKTARIQFKELLGLSFVFRF